MTLKLQSFLFWIILLLAAFLRLFKLGEIPAGINQDEAYAAYEALSLLNNGTDSWNYHFPLYFISWGSGMNVLYSYLTIPSIILLGTETWVIRLPQALCGILSCYIFYCLLRTIFNRPQALLGFFLSAIIPWHILLSRWGLEANLVPFFILSGLYFFLRSHKNPAYLLLSAIFYGLGLYAYAATWIYICLTFGIQLIYLQYYHRTQQYFTHILTAAVLFSLFAFPLFIFILINNNIIPEIKLSFLSIPKLIYFRQNEIGFNDLSTKFYALNRILLKSDDYLITNRLSPYGIFYPISLPFIIIGLYKLGKQSLTDIKTHQFSAYVIILISILIGLIYAITIYPCINRLNFLWFNLLIALTLGLAAFINKPKIFYVFIGLYLCYGAFFTFDYISNYNKLAKQNFTPDLKPALALAEKYHQQTNLPIYILEQPSVYPKILFYNKIPSTLFQQTVSWKRYPDEYLDTTSFLHYHFFSNYDYLKLTTNSIYIAPIKNVYYFYQFDITKFGQYFVAIPKNQQSSY